MPQLSSRMLSPSPVQTALNRFNGGSVNGQINGQLNGQINGQIDGGQQINGLYYYGYKQVRGGDSRKT